MVICSEQCATNMLLEFKRQWETLREFEKEILPNETDNINLGANFSETCANFINWNYSS